MVFSLRHDQAVTLLYRFVDSLEQVIVGKRAEIELTVIALLSGGHVLLEDVPGVGKTLLVRSIAKGLGGSFGRVQFTPDLMPSDITGVSVYRPNTGEFEFRPGPVLSNVVLADEINRATPRTQSALLEAMEERKVTVDGASHRLPAPFLLLATQNPLHFEGTYRLPEAQLDRFLMRISLGYPSFEQELVLLEKHGGEDPLDTLRPVLLAEEVLGMQRQVKAVMVDESIKRYMVTVADASRSHSGTLLGISPRGTLAWMTASKAHAYLKGRMYVIPDDVKAVAAAVLPHRLMLSAEARLSGQMAEEIIYGLLAKTPVPVTSRAIGGV